MKNIEQRKNTILRVCQSIVRRQVDFLDRGIDQLKPMMIKDVASEKASSSGFMIAEQFFGELAPLLRRRLTNPECMPAPVHLQGENRYLPQTGAAGHHRRHCEMLRGRIRTCPPPSSPVVS
ncbi:MAG: hypothetical protein M1541_14155 [Acidobacteria bacterium]|nr:hypothetical protein [Acidobacteriota bacterium]